MRCGRVPGPDWPGLCEYAHCARPPDAHLISSQSFDQPGIRLLLREYRSYLSFAARDSLLTELKTRVLDASLSGALQLTELCTFPVMDTFDRLISTYTD